MAIVNLHSDITYVKIEYTSPHMPRIWQVGEEDDLFNFLRVILRKPIDDLKPEIRKKYEVYQGLFNREMVRLGELE